jgi:hypothetical protein
MMREPQEFRRSRRNRTTERIRARLAVETLEDRAVPSVNLSEAEPNNTPALANAVPRLLDEQVIVSGMWSVETIYL